MNTTLIRPRTPPQFWLLCTLFVVYLFNVLAVEFLAFITPAQIACGYVPDVNKECSLHKFFNGEVW